MSPRSTEFLDAARRRLAAAEVVIEKDPATALSAAYYAMLYGARAALSERGIAVKTHRGAWHEFRRAFVDSGEIDPGCSPGSVRHSVQARGRKPRARPGSLVAFHTCERWSWTLPQQGSSSCWSAGAAQVLIASMRSGRVSTTWSLRRVTPMAISKARFTGSSGLLPGRWA